MQQTLFQALGVCFVVFAIVRFIRQQSKSQEMPFRRYWLVYALWAWCMGCFLYGFIFFIDAPFHENTPQTPCVKAEFCGKGGMPHTRQEFESFVVWQNMLLLSFLFGVPTMFVSQWISKRQKTVSSSSKE
jgi:hypothetical protein